MTSAFNWKLNQHAKLSKENFWALLFSLWHFGHVDTVKWMSYWGSFCMHYTAIIMRKDMCDIDKEKWHFFCSYTQELNQHNKTDRITLAGVRSAIRGWVLYSFSRCNRPNCPFLFVKKASYRKKKFQDVPKCQKKTLLDLS